MLSNNAYKLVKYVIPTVLSEICFFLFTIIDGVFAGNGVGTDALGAINIVWPLIIVICALIMLTTIGGITVTAIRLGRGDTAGANKAFMNSLYGTFVIALVLSLSGMLFTRPIGYLLGANETYIGMVCEYMFWYSAFIVPSSLAMAFQGFCRNDGSPILVTAAVMISSGMNIFLDWLFIFPLGMGLAGAAIASGISQTASFLICLTHFLKKRGQLRISFCAPDGKLMQKIVKRGFPETVSQFASPISMLCMNYVLLSRIGEIAVNSYSIIGYVASFSIAIFIGVSSGLQPLFGQSYGKKSESDLKYFFRAGVLINLIGSMLCMVLVFFIGGSVCKLFGTNEETLEFAVHAMPLYLWGFIVMSLNTVISSYLYSTKRTREALIMNCLRSFLFTWSITVFLPAIFGNGIIWHTFGIYEICSLAIAVILVKRSERNGIDFH